MEPIISIIQMNPMTPIKDKIYSLIINRLIRIYDSTSNKYMPPKYQFTEHKEHFIIDYNKLALSSELLLRMEHFKHWSEIYGHVSPESYTAIIMLDSYSNINLPLFKSFNSMRIQNLMNGLNNKFISQNTKNELIACFCKFKKTYWGFTKLARMWKLSRIPIRIQTDLYMNELNPNSPNTFKLINTNGIYLFSLQNLNRIIVDAITHQSGMFVEPLHIKNPYTNDLLLKCDLFNIYLQSRMNHIRIHEMFEKFFRCEFNIFEFRRIHETELRDYAIDQYVKSGSISELLQDVDDMLRMHKMTKKINITPGFPQKTLVETMRPFLKLYLLERFSFSSMTRKYSAMKLDIELNQFAKTNPIYGRRITSDSYLSLMPNHTQPTNPFVPSYITEVIHTTESYCSSKYMCTHIYNEDIFDNYVENGDTYLETVVYPEPNNIANVQDQTQDEDPDEDQDQDPDEDQDEDPDEDQDEDPDDEFIFSPPTNIANIHQINTNTNTNANMNNVEEAEEEEEAEEAEEEEGEEDSTLSDMDIYIGTDTEDEFINELDGYDSVS